MSKLVISLIGVGNERVGRVNVNLEGLPDDYDLFEEVVLIPLEAPAIVLGLQLNSVPTKEEP